MVANDTPTHKSNSYFQKYITELVKFYWLSKEAFFSL